MWGPHDPHLADAEQEVGESASAIAIMLELGHQKEALDLMLLQLLCLRLSVPQKL